jgi:hypothetical protein
MHPSYLKLLKSKKKRVRDPNLPPPPTLLGQVKELRLTKEELERVQLQLNITQQRLDYIENRYRRLESSFEALENWIRNRSK